MYLVHVGKEAFCDLDIDGRKYEFIPNEPMEIADDHFANALMERHARRGLVAVPVRRDRNGIHFDMDGAVRQAAEQLKTGRREMVEHYITTQRETRVQKGLPPLPPSAVVKKIIEEEGIDLAKYGITPVAWGIGTENTPDARMRELEERNRQMEQMVKALMERTEILTAALENKKFKAS